MVNMIKNFGNYFVKKGRIGTNDNTDYDPNTMIGIEDDGVLYVYLAKDAGEGRRIVESFRDLEESRCGHRIKIIGQHPSYLLDYDHDETGHNDE